ncbi:Lactococcin-G-processing and transport ATP-binding protein LagD [Lacunisphaera limnophila]|uniref:Lactococcin-G-processing and transport ATP-binding protein LagD n=1 Tax=Lacunisphaera limnophila TaxID=1838286 RepID=A0A1D8AYX3_9BACT|nr:peptidase domain-containing ABC transporter [Lacunisphaera limnophila]AOS46061.1 Lactococcin-G-processing and transport ATP-binding protein LagD [Lacunisphaera limnophila]
MIAIKQRDVTDCGAACLAAIAAHHGLRHSVTYLRSLAGTTQQGTTALGLVEAARKLGLTATGLKGTFEQATAASLPVIAHCLLEERGLHYVVVTQLSDQRVEVMDPAEGRTVEWSPEKFKSVWTGVLLKLEPGVGFVTGDRTVTARRRLWHLVWPHRVDLGLAFIMSVLGTLFTLGTAVYVQKLVDEIIPARDTGYLYLMGVVMLALLLARLGLAAGQSLLALRTAQRMDTDLIQSYYTHLLGLPQVFFDTMRVGEITSRVGDAVNVRAFLNSTLPQLLLNPLLILFSLAGMFLYAPQLALVSVALLPAGAAIYWCMDRGNRRTERDLMEKAADFAAQFTESLAAQSVIRRFRTEAHAVRKTGVKLQLLQESIRQSSLLSLSGGLATALLTQASLLGVLWGGGVLVLRGQLTLGELMSCYTLTSFLTVPLVGLIGLSTSVQDALIAADRLYEIMDLAKEKDGGTVIFAGDAPLAVHIDRVSFRHVGRRATLDDVRLTFPPGRITVLAGESGCGKSTLLALIQRLYLPDRGQIRFGGIDFQAFTLESLRRNLAVVPQATVLLSGTVLENLAPGEAHPNIPRLHALCREVGVLELIENLPRGFLTHLTENGANLSGGQRQRLAIVRALYRDAPVLLLDEPTASLDAASESRVLDLLRRLRNEGRTLVIAAHHPAVLGCADQVVEMKGGRVTGVRLQNQSPPTAKDWTAL